MICPKCKGRWAPFPKEDFKFVAGKGFVAKNSEVEKTRSAVFNADNLEYCGCEEDDNMEIIYPNKEGIGV